VDTGAFLVPHLRDGKQSVVSPDWHVPAPIRIADHAGSDTPLFSNETNLKDRISVW
jgi:hypothetical protein